MIFAAEEHAISGMITEVDGLRVKIKNQYKHRQIALYLALSIPLVGGCNSYFHCL